MASLADICTVNTVSQTASSPATPTRGIGRFGTPRSVFSPIRYFPAKPAACNGDGEMFCSSVLLKSVRPLLEKLASQGVSDGQHKPTKVLVVPDAPDVKRPGIGRFGGKPAASVVAPVVVPSAPSPSAVVAPVVVPEVAPVALMASTTPQVPEASVTTEAITEEASACAADQSEKARWSKLHEEVRAMDIASKHAAYLRWDKRSKEASWAMEIEAAIEAALRTCFLPKHPNTVANLTSKIVPPASAATVAVAVSASPAASSPAPKIAVKSPDAASPVRGAAAAAAAAAAAQKPKPSCCFSKLQGGG
ncbi:unnamed protein product [Closterium sp. Yama58-4]|nr:unnamed protein product [Closterium sp. Yama58-4]